MEEARRYQTQLTREKERFDESPERGKKEEKETRPSSLKGYYKKLDNYYSPLNDY